MVGKRWLSDAAIALRPLAGSSAQTLFGLGLVGAGLLAVAIVPLSTAYSVAESFGQCCDLNDSLRQSPLLYGAYGVSILLAEPVRLSESQTRSGSRRVDRPHSGRATNPDPIPLPSAQRGCCCSRS